MDALPMLHRRYSQISCVRSVFADPLNIFSALFTVEPINWGGRIRTFEYRFQRPVPYHLATPQIFRKYSGLDKGLVTFTFPNDATRGTARSASSALPKTPKIALPVPDSAALRAPAPSSSFLIVLRRG